VSRRKILEPEAGEEQEVKRRTPMLKKKNLPVKRSLSLRMRPQRKRVYKE